MPGRDITIFILIQDKPETVDSAFKNRKVIGCHCRQFIDTLSRMNRYHMTIRLKKHRNRYTGKEIAVMRKVPRYQTLQSRLKVLV